MAGVPKISIQIMQLDRRHPEPLFADHLPVEFALEAVLTFIRENFDQDHRDVVIIDVIGLIHSVVSDAAAPSAHLDLPMDNYRLEVSRHQALDATLADAENRDKMLFRMSYAYDAPHYFDFVVEASTEAEAMRLAEAALASGTFDEVDAVEPSDYDKNDERVFIGGIELDENEVQFEPRLVDGLLNDFDAVPLAYPR